MRKQRNDFLEMYMNTKNPFAKSNDLPADIARDVTEMKNDTAELHKLVSTVSDTYDALPPVPDIDSTDADIKRVEKELDTSLNDAIVELATKKEE